MLCFTFRSRVHTDVNILVNVTGFEVQTDKQVTCCCVDRGCRKRTPIVYCFKCTSYQQTASLAVISHFLFFQLRVVFALRGLEHIALGIPWS